MPMAAGGDYDRQKHRESYGVEAHLDGKRPV